MRWDREQQEHLLRLRQLSHVRGRRRPVAGLLLLLRHIERPRLRRLRVRNHVRRRRLLLHRVAPRGEAHRRLRRARLDVVASRRLQRVRSRRHPRGALRDPVRNLPRDCGGGRGDRGVESPLGESRCRRCAGKRKQGLRTGASPATSPPGVSIIWTAGACIGITGTVSSPLSRASIWICRRQNGAGNRPS